MDRLGTRRLAFWAAVAGVAVLANFGVEVVAQRYPNAGFTKFVNFSHGGTR